MRYRYKIPLASTALLFFLVLGFLFFYYSFISKNTSEIVLDSSLSINFIKNNKINEQNFDNINFSVTNDDDNVVYYYISFSNVFSKNKISYELKHDKEILKKGIFKNTIIESNIMINSGETHNYTLDLFPGSADEFSGKIIIKKEGVLENNFSEVIIASNKVKKETISKPSSEAALLNEGLIQDVDDDGKTYYFRGDINNNYFKFNDLLWRIVRINGDGTVRLILDSLTKDVTFFTNTEDYSFPSSNILKFLNSWFNENILSNVDLVANSKFCVDNTLSNNNLAPLPRVSVDDVVSFQCLGDVINSKVGLLTMDEFVFAGGKYQEKNTSFYLHSENMTSDYFLLTGAKMAGTNYHTFTVSEGSKLTSDAAAFTNRGVRVVINVVKNVSVDGDGTINNPYIIKEKVE